MESIELIIKIPKEDYLAYSRLSEKEKVNELSYYEKIIASGKPLPKRHGALIDADKLIKKIINLSKCPNGYSQVYDEAMIINMIEDESIIIEANKEKK